MKRLFVLFLILFSFNSVFAVGTAPNPVDTDLYYSFDNDNITGSNPLDLTGVIGTGATTGATTGANGIVEQAFTYDGDGDYVQTPSFQEALTNTYCVWFNQIGISGSRNTIISKRPSSGDRDFQMVVTGATNRIDVNYYDGGTGGAGSMQSTTTITDNTDYFVCITRSNNNVELFVNGVSEDTDTTTGKARENKALQIGIYEGASGGTNAMNGIIDELSYFDVVLSQDEIDYLYASANPSSSQQYPFINTATQIQSNISTFGTINLENITGSATTTAIVNMTFYQNGVQIGSVNETNSSSYTLTNLNLGVNNISLRSINENGTNWNNFSLTYQPYQYFYFETALGSPITNFTLDGIDYENYANISASSLNYGSNSLTFSKLGYTTSTINFNLTISSQINNTYNASPARIILNIRDKSTGTLFTGINFSVEFIATTGVLTSTTTGVVNITNTLFQNEAYLAVISSADYQTETLNFNFNNQEELELNVYMIESNNTNLGVVFIEPVSSFGQNLVGVIVKALQWDSSTSSYIEVSQAVTGSDGLGALNVILNDKVYIFTASQGGISANSTSEKIDTTENGKTITLILSGTAAEYNYLFENVQATVTESYNTTTNVSTMTFTWENTDGIAVTACLNSYRLISTSETQLSESCTTAASGISIINFNINSSYTTILKGEFKLNSGVYVPVNTFRHFPANSLPNLLADLGLNIVLVPIMFLAALAIGMLMQNVYIGTMLIFIFGGFSLFLAPTILTQGIVAFLGLVSILTLIYGVKPR